MSQPAASGALTGTLTVTAPVADAVTLKLVPKRKKKKSVQWAEDVPEVDEFSGKKKSKKCCIFHKQRSWGDWSDGEDSDGECACGPGDGKPDQQQPPQQPKGPPPPQPGLP
ncbi:hypothetical protein Rsub_12067 [Raphidocelis subcapitata]|uniref:Type 1 phosphatases regulator n=1 Tax=Raphidocelis subcapitata TaxID=307507 RepID=A0A2V0PNE3_9CHLO|nr:hypothetical protein Rsub_12067 [Raphidocelis subcapitata]|eukprot:GBF99603.1 hypothetical protein Rsub_12067 [Raphidocelis subcapitata]